MDSVKENNKADDFPDIKEFDKKYILSMEKEMLGLYISGHPLDDYTKEIDMLTNTKISDIVVLDDEEDMVGQTKINDGQKVVVGGIISEVSIKSTKKNEIMAFVKLEDMIASIEVLVFPKVYQRCSRMLLEDSLAIVKGRISIKEDEQPKIIADEIEPLKKKMDSEIKRLYIRLSDTLWKKQIEELKPLLLKYKGLNPVYVVLKDSKKIFMSSREMWVEISDNLIDELNKTLGNENVKIQ